MIYLDSAATTLQKPATVRNAVRDAMGRMASPGRGGHRPAALAAETVFGCRQCAAELFHLSSPEQVVFTFNATHALNLAIKTLVRPGDEVVISGYEHNAVTRPLAALDCLVRIARTDLDHISDLPQEMEKRITARTSCVICTHVSNVFGAVLPICEIAELCRKRELPLIIDASQSAGCLPVHMDELNCAFIAMPGHKGLYGPQGTGMLLCGEQCEPHPLMEGGTGSNSRLQTMPDFLPDMLEAGTLNVPGIAGLWSGMRYIRAKGLDHIRAHEQELLDRAVRSMRELPGLTLYRGSGPHTGVLSFRAENWDSEELGEALGQRGIAVRAGLHCAPLAHESMGTLEGGTVRISVSDFNTLWEMERFTQVLSHLLQ